MAFGSTGKMLRVDLSRGSMHVEDIDEAFYRLHPGGKALAVPAEQALAMRRLRSDWAGIPWDC
jgi:aldehyde:ferredoxin oxidoreductase